MKNQTCLSVLENGGKLKIAALCCCLCWLVLGCFNFSIEGGEDASADSGCKCAIEDGPCCDGCSFYPEDAHHVCANLTEYQCKSQTCGADAMRRASAQECDGTTAKCTGQIANEGWIIDEPCDENELCFESEGERAVCRGAVECMGNNWVGIQGGAYQMGSDVAWDFADEQPPHNVTLSQFEILKSEVTVAQYKKCTDENDCSQPGDGKGCHWNVVGRNGHPINCVDWQQAKAFCLWAGGRLPTEAEWEYAARSKGQNILYPWGNATNPACDFAVVDNGNPGCGEGTPFASCSKTAGNTAQGLCDMAGNVWEWTADWSSCSYEKETSESSCTTYGGPCGLECWEDDPKGPCQGAESCLSRTHKVLRGGSFLQNIENARAANRFHLSPNQKAQDIGFRCVRD